MNAPPPDPPVPVPSTYPEVPCGSDLRVLLRRQVDSQFVDLATLLQLPRPELGLDGGGNLTAAALACNILSGASVLFYESSLAAVKNKPNKTTNTLGSGERFRRVLRGFLPWAHIGVEPEDDVVDLLYKYTRNPLAHSLGIGKSAHVAGFHGKHVLMEKPGLGLPRPDVIELMRGDEPPPETCSPVVRQTATEYVVYVPGLAWAVCRLLRNLLGHPSQRAKSTALAEELAHGIYDPYAEVDDEGGVSVPDDADSSLRDPSAGHTEYVAASGAVPPAPPDARPGTV
jgi:hypothetical protein